MPPRTKWIKKKAHAYTWAAIWCLIFFVPACFGVMSSDFEARLVSGLVIVFEALLIFAAAICWSREKQQEVSWEVE